MIRQIILISTFLFTFSTTAFSTKPDLIQIPFRVIGKMIVVHGYINGSPGNLAIDTGIPNVIINQRFFKDIELFRTGASEGFQSLSGEAGSKGVALITLNMQDFSIKAGANVLNLQAIERQKRTNILGMVGINIFHKYQLEIDYLSEVIRLYRLDRHGQCRLQQPEALPSETLSFQYYQHLPCITTYLHGMPLQLGLDTGAEKTLLVESIYKKMNLQLRNIRSQKMMDLHGQSTDAIAAQIDGLQVGELEISAIPVLFVPLSTYYGGLNGKKIHGLLGYDFLRYFRIAINFKKRKVYLWDAQQNENMPIVIKRN